MRFEYKEPGELAKLEELLSETRRLEADYPGLPIWWRGQGSFAWSLKPSIGRPHRFLGSEKTFAEDEERYLLDRFRRHAYTHYNRRIDRWEALFVARHHRLPVRLIDWSSNPLVGLYFASTYEKEGYWEDAPAAPSAARLKLPGDGAVWAFVRKPLRASAPPGYFLDVMDGGLDPFDVKGIRIVYPFYPSPRMIAQTGAFTIHGDPRVAVEGQRLSDFRDEDLDILVLLKWKVPEVARRDIMRQLERVDVNTRRLFPDLDGLARGLANTEVIKIL